MGSLPYHTLLGTPAAILPLMTELATYAPVLAVHGKKPWAQRRRIPLGERALCAS